MSAPARTRSQHTSHTLFWAGDSGGVASRRSPDRCLNSEVGWLRPRPRSIPHVVYGDVMYLLLYYVSTAHPPQPHGHTAHKWVNASGWTFTRFDRSCLWLSDRTFCHETANAVERGGSRNASCLESIRRFHAQPPSGSHSTLKISMSRVGSSLEIAIVQVLRLRTPP